MNNAYNKQAPLIWKLNLSDLQYIPNWTEAILLNFQASLKLPKLKEAGLSNPQT